MTKAIHGKQGRERVARAIQTHGPMTEENIIKNIPEGARHKYNLLRVIESMMQANLMTCVKGVYNIAPEIHAWLADLDEIESRKPIPEKVVQPRSAPTFAPLRLSRLPNPRGTRETDYQERHFVTLASNLPTIYHDDR